MQPFIRVHQLRQSFGTQEVLKGVSFDVGKGELMALIGGSGAGKSVILKHLDGLMDPLDGYVEIDGRRISGAPEKIKKQIRSKIGFMFQQGALFDSLSVGENVAFPLREAGIRDEIGSHSNSDKHTLYRDENELDTRISAALDSVGLLGQQEKMPASLSGGMIKRVAVARAIITTPECLLYDEPTAGLDPIVTDSISFLIRQICKDKGITTVIVSHDMPSVIRIADKIVYLRNGEVYWTGTPEELLHSKDEILQKFLYGDSGENWAALSGKNENFQRILLERAERERKQ